MKLIQLLFRKYLKHLNLSTYKNQSLFKKILKRLEIKLFKLNQKWYQQGVYILIMR